MPGYRLPAASILLTALAACGPAAREIAIACPATGILGALDFVFKADTLTITEDGRTTTIPARLEGDPSGIYAIGATGQFETALPPLSSMDACIAEGLKTPGLSPDDPDDIVYAAYGCASSLASDQVVQTATMTLEITVLEAEDAMAFVTRTYPEPSTISGAPLEIPELPPRGCVVTTR